MSTTPDYPQRIGRFDVTEILGRGAMGVVYLAVDPVLDREVAIKTILVHPGLAESEVNELRQRFENEARSAAKLSHPNLVTIFDAGLQDDSLYIAMEYVRGEALDQVIGSGRVLTYKEVSDLMLQLAGALDHAHAEGIVHRDIKPANILINRRGQPKITDFGVARAATSTLTMTGTIIGTPAYMSPEQITGHPVTGASDQFSLAIVLYELLTGRKPFIGEGATTILYKIVHEEPEPPNSVRKTLPESIDHVLMRALSKDPAARFANCEELAEAVRDTLGAAPADSAVLLSSTGSRPAPVAVDAEASWRPSDAEAVTQIAAPGGSIPQETVEASPTSTAPTPAGSTPGAAAVTEPLLTAKPVAAQRAEPSSSNRMLIIGGTALGVVTILVVAAMVGSGGEEPASVAGTEAAGGAEAGAGGEGVAGTQSGTATSVGSGVPAPTGPVSPTSSEAVVYSIVSQPAGARLTLDGERSRQATPVDVMLRPGQRYSVRLEAPGHDPVSWAFSIEDLSAEQQEQRRLFFPLERTVAATPDGGPAPPVGGRGRPGMDGRRGPPPGGPIPQNPVRVRGDVQAPEVLEKVEPDFPEWAAEQGLSKYVVVELIIDRAGRVRDVTVLSTVHPTLQRMAIEAARAWRFAPATRNGEPVAVRHNISINFRTGEDGLQ